MQQGYPPGGGQPPQQNPYAAPAAQPGQQAMQQHGGGLGRLEIHTSFFFLAWILFFVSTGIEINGQKHGRPWGNSYFDLPAGTYHLKIYFNYLFGPAGVSTRQVTIYEGHTTKLRYSAPWIVFLSGTVYESPPQPWNQLPQGQYQQQQY